MIHTDDFSVEVVFASGSPNQAFASYVAQLPDQLRDNTHVLLVLHRYCRRATLRTSEVAALLQVSSEEALRTLEWMAAPEVGLLARSRSGGENAWRLRPEVIQALGSAVRHRRRLGDLDDRVLDHVDEYGWITNRTLRNFLQLDVQQARAVLDDLRNRGLLVKDPSGAERGPHVRWVRGPQAPRRR